MNTAIPEVIHKIETERIILRPVQSHDAEFIFQLFSSPAFRENIGDKQVYSVAEAEVFISEKIQSQFEEYKYGTYIMISKEKGEKLGTCGIYHREGLNLPDIGYALLPEFERKGYALEASRKMMSCAKNHYKINTLCAITAKHNHPSQKLLIKLGFKLKDTICLPGDSESLYLFEVSLSKKHR